MWTASTYGRECASQRGLEAPGESGRAPGVSLSPLRCPSGGSSAPVNCRHSSSFSPSGRGFFHQAEQDFWVPGEEVQITRLLNECKKSAELALKRISHLGLLKMGTKLVSKCSVSLLKLDQLVDRIEKSRRAFGTSASYRGISLAHVWWKCLVFPTLSADLIEARSLSKAL